jgi:hypothetical protein
LDKINSNNESVLKLVEAFREEASRNRILQVVEARKKEVDEEITRLESIDDLKFQLWGASRLEVL